MMISENLKKIKDSLPEKVTLVAVSKTRNPDEIMQAYKAGQRIFAENRVQELLRKKPLLPDDIRWHLIGHLQTNKVKQIAPFISLIHSVDSQRLLRELNKQARKCDRKIACLLQVHIAQEESKYGFTYEELERFFCTGTYHEYAHLVFRGLMGMATYTENKSQIRQEFSSLAAAFKQLKAHYQLPYFDFLSMGMSGDYPIAIEEGSNMIRIGKTIFND